MMHVHFSGLENTCNHCMQHKRCRYVKFYIPSESIKGCYYLCAVCRKKLVREIKERQGDFNIFKG